MRRIPYCRVRPRATDQRSGLDYQSTTTNRSRPADERRTPRDDARRLRWSRVVLGASPPERRTEPSDPTERLTLVAALRQVPPRQRAVLVLRYFQDLSVEDTARALGCSAGTVKSQAAKGLAALRAVLDTAPVGR
ncbi:sigma-70 family RNA polymerase sigma factor [Micromonospora avicenniae]|uniref:sigma-70 family RNA polymerase sigma factor n=1 Tax=Micromonospora avicenniae TaxID=1198245 RepID=UPI003332C89C